MRRYSIVSGLLLVAAAVLALLHFGLPALLAALAALVVALAGVLRRKGRPGDFSRSRWTGS
jgi:hypothetical protein